MAFKACSGQFECEQRVRRLTITANSSMNKVSTGQLETLGATSTVNVFPKALFQFRVASPLLVRTEE